MMKRLALLAAVKAIVAMADGAAPAAAVDAAIKESLSADAAAVDAEKAEAVKKSDEVAADVEKQIEELEEKEKVAAEVKVDGFSSEELNKMENSSEKHEFQAEVSRLMDIIINSLYSDKQVFLRELVSNAADALEKARLASIKDSEFLGETPDLEIKIEHDPEAKTISIIDTGIGMTKQELLENLGTVAKSGTTNFLEAMQDGDSVSPDQRQNLIGQFGVGFYSSFLVADKVTVTSKNNEDGLQHVWESTADASFSIAEDPRGDTLGRGTRITLHLKEDAMELLNESKIREIVQKHSQFTQFPIYVKTKKEVEKEDADDDDDDDEDDDEDEEETELSEEEKEKKAQEKKDAKAAAKKTKKETVFEWDQLNTQKAIWLRNKDEIKPEEYEAFYKSLSKDHQGPLTYTHFNAEGEIDFKSLLFIPENSPMGMFTNYHDQKALVKLFVRRVLVADENTGDKSVDLLPKYLSFVRGVVDSDDLPLNVSREQLQQNKIMQVIKKKLVRKVLEMLRSMSKEAETDVSDLGTDAEIDEQVEKEFKEKAEQEEKEENGEKKEEKTEEDKTKELAEAKKQRKEERDQQKADVEHAQTKYSDFLKKFGDQLRMGCHEDDSNRSKIAQLLRFHSTKTQATKGLPISLNKYVENMTEKQEEIYYIAGESLETMMKSPVLEQFKKMGVEVLMLDSTLDEGCMQKVADFNGKKLVSVQKTDVDLSKLESTETKEKFTKMTKFYEPLTKWWTETLKPTNAAVSSVVLSKRLTNTPCVVVSSQFSAHQEKMMKAQAFQNKEMMAAMYTGSKTLEINASHPVVHDLLLKVKEAGSDAEKLKEHEETAVTLFQTAMLEGGYPIDDPSTLTQRLYKLMSKELGVDPEAPVTEIELPAEEEKEEEATEEDEEAVEEEKVEEKTEEKTEEKAEEKTEENTEAKSEL